MIDVRRSLTICFPPLLLSDFLATSVYAINQRRNQNMVNARRICRSLLINSNRRNLSVFILIICMHLRTLYDRVEWKIWSIKWFICLEGTGTWSKIKMRLVYIPWVTAYFRALDSESWHQLDLAYSSYPLNRTMWLLRGDSPQGKTYKPDILLKAWLLSNSKYNQFKQKDCVAGWGHILHER